MEIDVSQESELQLKKIYTPITLISEKLDTISICMRDSGFEFKYGEVWYEAKDGIVQFLKSKEVI